MYADLLGTWTTPAGNPASYTFRDDTNDWNTLSSIHDPVNEYDLPTGLSGWAFDIGGYLGGVSIALALDNPDLRVLCIEPIPDNLRLIRANVERNDLTERVVVIDGSAGTDPLVSFMGRGTHPAEHHAFVGNASYVFEAPSHDEIVARCYSLAHLMEMVGAERLSFLKIDCEGCEWSFLRSRSLAGVERIGGEWHPPGTAQRLQQMLARTHDVSFIGDHGFSAVLR